MIFLWIKIFYKESVKLTATSLFTMSLLWLWRRSSEVMANTAITPYIINGNKYRDHVYLSLFGAFNQKSAF